MESITCILNPKSYTFVDEFGYVTRLINPSFGEELEIQTRMHPVKDWTFQNLDNDEGWVATKGERYVRTGGPLDGKTFD